MPACSALLMGATNEVAETTVVAMPGEPAVTAALKEDSMVGTVGWVDSAPVHLGVVGKLPAASFAVEVGAAPLELDELHAAMSAEAAAVALNRPAPSSSRR